MSSVTVRLDIRRFFPESAEVAESGKPKRIPVTVRTLFLTDPAPIVGSGIHKVSQTKRSGQLRYTVYERPRLPLMRECLPNGTAVRRWRVDESKWVKTDSLTEETIWSWLTVRLGVPGAGAVLTALQSAEPIGE